MPPRRGETIEEYRKRMRERYATDPEYRERRRGPLRERRRERYAVNPEYREHRPWLSFRAALHQMLRDRLGAVYDIQG